MAGDGKSAKPKEEWIRILLQYAQHKGSDSFFTRGKGPRKGTWAWDMKEKIDKCRSRIESRGTIVNYLSKEKERKAPPKCTCRYHIQYINRTEGSRVVPGQSLGLNRDPLGSAWGVPPPRKKNGQPRGDVVAATHRGDVAQGHPSSFVSGKYADKQQQIVVANNLKKPPPQVVADAPPGTGRTGQVSNPYLKPAAVQVLEISSRAAKQKTMALIKLMEECTPWLETTHDPGRFLADLKKTKYAQELEPPFLGGRRTRTPRGLKQKPQQLQQKQIEGGNRIIKTEGYFDLHVAMSLKGTCRRCPPSDETKPPDWVPRGASRLKMVYTMGWPFYVQGMSLMCNHCRKYTTSHDLNYMNTLPYSERLDRSWISSGKANGMDMSIIRAMRLGVSAATVESMCRAGINVLYEEERDAYEEACERFSSDEDCEPFPEFPEDYVPKRAAIAEAFLADFRQHQSDLKRELKRYVSTHMLAIDGQRQVVKRVQSQDRGGGMYTVTITGDHGLVLWCGVVPTDAFQYKTKALEEVVNRHDGQTLPKFLYVDCNCCNGLAGGERVSYSFRTGPGQVPRLLKTKLDGMHLIMRVNKEINGEHPRKAGFMNQLSKALYCCCPTDLANLQLAQKKTGMELTTKQKNADIKRFVRRTIRGGREAAGMFLLVMYSQMGLDERCRQQAQQSGMDITKQNRASPFYPIITETVRRVLVQQCIHLLNGCVVDEDEMYIRGEQINYRCTGVYLFTWNYFRSTCGTETWHSVIGKHFYRWTNISVETFNARLLWSMIHYDRKKLKKVAGTDKTKIPPDGVAPSEFPKVELAPNADDLHIGYEYYDKIMNEQLAQQQREAECEVAIERKKEAEKDLSQMEGTLRGKKDGEIRELESPQEYESGGEDQVEEDYLEEIVEDALQEMGTGITSTKPAYRYCALEFENAKKAVVEAGFTVQRLVDEIKEHEPAVVLERIKTATTLRTSAEAKKIYSGIRREIESERKRKRDSDGIVTATFIERTQIYAKAQETTKKAVSLLMESTEGHEGQDTMDRLIPVSEKEDGNDPSSSAKDTRPGKTERGLGAEAAAVKLMEEHIVEKVVVDKARSDLIKAKSRKATDRRQAMAKQASVLVPCRFTKAMSEAFDKIFNDIGVVSGRKSIGTLATEAMKAYQLRLARREKREQLWPTSYDYVKEELGKMFENMNGAVREGYASNEAVALVVGLAKAQGAGGGGATQFGDGINPLKQRYIGTTEPQPVDLASPSVRRLQDTDSRNDVQKGRPKKKPRLSKFTDEDKARMAKAREMVAALEFVRPESDSTNCKLCGMPRTKDVKYPMRGTPGRKEAHRHNRNKCTYCPFADDPIVLEEWEEAKKKANRERTRRCREKKKMEG